MAASGVDRFAHDLVDLASSASVALLVSHTSFFVKPLKNGSVSSMTNASSLMIMQAALSSVNCALKVKPRVAKNSIDF
jgi:hypothetical protein